MEKVSLKERAAKIAERRDGMATQIDKQQATIVDLRRRIEALEQKCAMPNRQSIQRVEEFNGEVVPEPEDRMKMSTSDKLASMLNTIRILPPNMIVNGRHSKSNVEALVGFKVSDEMMDELYANFSHE